MTWMTLLRSSLRSLFNVFIASSPQHSVLTHCQSMVYFIIRVSYTNYYFSHDVLMKKLSSGLLLLQTVFTYPLNCYSLAPGADFPLLPPGFNPESGYMGFLVDKMPLGPAFSQYFCFPHEFSFHQLFHIHHSIIRHRVVSIMKRSLNNKWKH
jgi:hypothetical protein